MSSTQLKAVAWGWRSSIAPIHLPRDPVFKFVALISLAGLLAFLSGYGLHFFYIVARTHFLFPDAPATTSIILYSTLG